MSQSRPVKRKFHERVSRACDMCRRKKMKCDQRQPCQTCKDRVFRCVYSDKRTRESKKLRPVGDLLQLEQSFSDLHSSETINQNEETEDARQIGIAQDEARSILVSPPQSNEDDEVVGGKNTHTTGIEFYGNCSNFALLSQLFSRANKISGGTSKASGNNVRSPLSIVDILYDDQSTIPDPVPATPVTAAGRSSRLHRSQTDVSPENSRPSTTRPGESNPDIRAAIRQSDLWNCFVGSPMRLEMEYINLFFDNIHTTLAFLDRDDFVTRCDQEIWVRSSVKQLRRDQMHFFALYNAVLAVVALTASTDALFSLRLELEISLTEASTSASRNPRSAPSSLLLSKLYFWRARHLLGDLFEVCSVESAQALLLMSIYCQHALKPHACYMYSGMAVRTALAIGLSSNGQRRSEQSSLAGCRTWWAIYLQDIEASCSSGRSSTLGEPSEYALSYGRFSGGLVSSEAKIGPNSMETHVAVLVDVSAILQRASKRLYHLSDLALLTDKSQIAIELDQELIFWKSRLPEHLDFELESFTGPEWAAKQKLCLQLRFYHIRMFIHRPLLSTTEGDLGAKHMQICLEAAQRTIGLIYDAYQHRHYFRTWWYNTIYILYASLIVLYAILLGYSRVPLDWLLQDVQKALKVLDSMKDLKVARRCTDLIEEILHITKCYAESNGGQNSANNSPLHQASPTHGSIHSMREASFRHDIHSQLQNQAQEEAFSLNQLPGDLFLMRDDILAYLEDPGALEGFAIDLDSSNLMDFDYALLEGE
ncbi:fungal-specific transcription factor domain-containing protein [Penicillium sp. IBT 35674x]|nr:fungal-specific transcription factor domain-containing protein [Penicillium sp. IBT 35674x]